MKEPGRRSKQIARFVVGVALTLVLGAAYSFRSSARADTCHNSYLPALTCNGCTGPSGYGCKGVEYPMERCSVDDWSCYDD